MDRNKVKLIETENIRELHIGSVIVTLNESQYQELIRIFSSKLLREKVIELAKTDPLI